MLKNWEPAATQQQFMQEDRGVPSLGEYASLVGSGTTGAEFIVEARKLSRGNLRMEFMAEGVNRWFRSKAGNLTRS